MKTRPKPQRKTRKGGDAHRTPGWVTAHPRASRMILAVITAGLLASLMVEWSPLSGARGLTDGDIAAQDIRASQTVEVVDAALSDEKREQARTSVSLVFEHDVLLARGVQDKIEATFTDTRAWFESATAVATPDPGPEPEATPVEDGEDVTPEEQPEPEEPARATIDPGALQLRLDQFESGLGVEIDETHLASLQMTGFSAEVQRDVAELVRAAMTEYVVQSRAELPAEGEVRVVRVEGSSTNEFPLDDFSRVRDLAGAQRFVAEEAERNFRDRPAHVRQAVVHVAEQLVVPNLRFDASETEVRRQLAAGSVQPVTTTYQKGQIVIRAGDEVTSWTLAVLDEMNAGARAYSPVRHMLALTVLLALFLGLLERFSVRFISKFRRRFYDLIAMAALLLLAAATARLLRALGIGLQDVVGSLPPSAFAFAVPVAVGGIIVRTLMNSETVLVWAVATAIVCADIGGGSPWLGVYYLASAMAAAGGVGHASERGRLVRAGFVAALANVAMVITLDVVALTGLSGSAVAVESLTGSLYHILFALGGGLISGVLAVGLVPVLEPLGFVTDSKLLELSNLNHPLVRDMIVKAPGTYHHSMVVGSLAEAAAEAIHSNSLLVRVGAYFHDVGKMLKPGYFIENQRDGENPHDRLTPTMSALVITNHVKEGIQLGIQHGLPRPIIDMIPQHHGTSRVSFFYNKALQQADPSKGEVQESSFRYPGPKPQTKEAAIMMMADGVEAATRSLSTHTEGAIRARVSKIVNSVVADGQLDECPLTLKDLHTVGETFIQVLLGIHHHRIEYPRAPDPSESKARAIPASSLTLEVPSMTPPPDAPHPLEQAAAERKAAADQNLEPVEISTTGELARSALADAEAAKDGDG